MHKIYRAPTVPPPSKAPDDLVAVAKALVPRLRSRAAETEALGRLPEATVKDLQATGMFDMAAPKKYGGLETSPRMLMDTIVELGRGDGAVAWTVNLLAGGMWMSAKMFPEEVSDQVYAPGQNHRTASVFAPRKVQTRNVDGGLLIEEGSWSFNSGVLHAAWDILGIPLLDEAGCFVDHALVAVPTSEITKLDDWDTIGLRGSGSVTVSVKDVFVPNERMTRIGTELREGFTSAHLSGQALYHLPIVPFLATKLVFPALGMAKGALDMYLENARNRGISYTSYPKQNEAPVTHLQVAEASAKIDAAELLLQRSVDEMSDSGSTGIRMSLEQRVRIRRDAGYASRLIAEAISILADGSGGSFAQFDNPLSRYWRDARVAGLHAGINTNSGMELYGRIVNGMEPNTPLL